MARKGRAVDMSRQQEEVYQTTIIGELTEKLGDRGRSATVEWPKVNRAPRKGLRCLLTGEEIVKGQLCVTIYATIESQTGAVSSNELVAVFRDEQVLLAAIDRGTLEPPTSP